VQKDTNAVPCQPGPAGLNSGRVQVEHGAGDLQFNVDEIRASMEKLTLQGYSHKYMSIKDIRN
jgi:hypothetical protein